MRILGTLLAISFLLGMCWHQLQWVDQEFLYIEAAHDSKENTVPVYAQFVAAQGLQLHSARHVSELQLPLYVSDLAIPFHVAISQGDTTIAEWERRPSSVGVTWEHLPVQPPVTLVGDLDVRVSSMVVAHDDREKAIRIFVESADEHYPHGNYRIAANEKLGDMSLRMFEKVSRGELTWRGWRDKPLTAIEDFSAVTLLVTVLYVVPQIRLFAKARTWK